MIKTYRFILCCFLLTIPFIASAQSWQKTYGGVSDDFGEDVSQTMDGGYIITGSTYDDSEIQSVYLIRTDSNGDTLWTKTYRKGIDAGYSVKQTDDGGFIVGCQTLSYTPRFQEISLIRTNSNGDTLWTRGYENGIGRQEFCGSIIITADKGYLIVGSSDDITDNFIELYLIKTDSNGDTLWTKSIGTDQDNFGYSGQQTKDGGYIISGATFSTSLNHYVADLVKINPNGDTLWMKTFSGNGDSYGASVIQTIDGGYAMAGYTTGVSEFDYYIVKTDSFGNQQWVKTIDEGGDDRAFSVVENDNGYVLAGYSRDLTATNALLQKVDLNGNPLWAKRFGATGDNNFNSIENVAGDGFVMLGSTTGSGAGGSDVWLVKSDCISFPMDTIFTNDSTFFCQDSGSVSVTLQSKTTSGLTYQWQNDSGAIAGATSSSYIADSAGTYSLMVADISGCSNPTNSIMVTVSPIPPKLVINQLGDTLITEGFFGTYQWYLNDTLIPGARGYTYIISRPGNYTVSYSLGGCSSLSDVFNATLLGVNTVEEEWSVSVSPNPFTSSATIRFNSQSGLQASNLQFILYDVLGRAMQQGEIKNGMYEIERGNLSSGLYFYQLKQAGNILTTGKVVVQ